MLYPCTTKALLFLSFTSFFTVKVQQPKFHHCMHFMCLCVETNQPIYIYKGSSHLQSEPNFVARHTGFNQFHRCFTCLCGAVLLFITIDNEVSLTWLLFSASQSQMQTSHVPAYLHFSNNEKHVARLVYAVYDAQKELCTFDVLSSQKGEQ